MVSNDQMIMMAWIFAALMGLRLIFVIVSAWWSR